MKPIRAERGWSVVSPWSTAPWLAACRPTRAMVAQFLDTHFNETRGADGWKANGWRFVKVAVVPTPPPALRRRRAGDGTP